MTYRQGRRNPNAIYEGEGPEPTDDDVFIGSTTTGHKAQCLVAAANRGLEAQRLMRAARSVADTATDGSVSHELLGQLYGDLCDVLDPAEDGDT
jgi:hypothetical protein